MDLYNILDEQACTVNFKAKDKIDALKKIASIAAHTPSLQGYSEELIFQKLQERELKGTTGFGKGVAIPHTRIDGMTDFLLFIVTSPKGVNFKSIDHKKVHLFFVLVGPSTNVSEHLKILASISRLLSQSGFKKELVKAPSRIALYEAFIRNTRMEDKAEIKIKKYKLLHIILYVEEFLYDILEYLLENGIEGATIIESYGMGQYISNIPLFASFIGFMKENKNQSKTIITLIPETQEQKLIEGIEKITGDLNKKQGAMVFTQEVSFSKGTMKMI